MRSPPRGGWRRSASRRRAGSCCWAGRTAAARCWRPGGWPPDLPAGLLRGLVAFYPSCRTPLAQADWRPAAPLLILVGASDDWVPPDACRALAARFPGQITFTAYPGAYHDFDVPNRPVRTLTGLTFSVGGKGVAHAGTDPAARADALKRVPAFLDALPPARQTAP